MSSKRNAQTTSKALTLEALSREGEIRAPIPSEWAPKGKGRPPECPGTPNELQDKTNPVGDAARIKPTEGRIR